ncbi:MAG: hypothetical protein QOF48_2934 [Verrucomicrobiota bacterium]|jgi:hypothetical protein
MKQQITAAIFTSVVSGSLLLAPASSMMAADGKRAPVDAVTKTVPPPPPGFLRLVKDKRALEERIAKKHRLQVPSQVWDFFTAAERGDWTATSNLFLSLKAGLRPPSGEAWLPTPFWSAILDTYGLYEKVAEWSPHFLNLISTGIAKSIPSGSMYFGGSDTGRFGPMLESASHSEGRPFFTLSQSALSNEAYLEYLRDMYGGSIYIPGTNEAQQCVAQYTEDAGRRWKHDQQFPLEPRQLRPGEGVQMVDGNIKVEGHVGVMGMNSLLAKAIFDKNPRREFYYVESFPLDWVYPHLTPHQFIFKVNRQPPAEISAATMRADRDFWTRHAEAWVGTWLNINTPIGEVTNFVIRIFHDQDLKQFKGDPGFIQDVEARKFFSKLRSAVGGVYSWRANATRLPAERQRLLDEADFAFRQAFVFAPTSAEAVFRYVNLLMSGGRVEDALRVAGAAQTLDPTNAQMENLGLELARMKQAANR